MSIIESADFEGHTADWPAWTVDHRFVIGPREGLTCRQEAVLACFEIAWQSGRAVPSVRQVARELGLSRCTVRGHVRRLVREGWLLRAPGARPPIRLSRESRALAGGTSPRRAAR
jgi:hypothetical protein